MLFFYMNLLNMQVVLSQKIYNAQVIVRQFFDVKNGVRSQQPSVLCQLVTSESQRTGISCPKEN